MQHSLFSPTEESHESQCLVCPVHLFYWCISCTFSYERIKWWWSDDWFFSLISGINWKYVKFNILINGILGSTKFQTWHVIGNVNCQLVKRVNVTDSRVNTLVVVCVCLWCNVDIACTERVKQPVFHLLSQSSQLQTIWMYITIKVSFVFGCYWCRLPCHRCLPLRCYTRTHTGLYYMFLISHFYVCFNHCNGNG